MFGLNCKVVIAALAIGAVAAIIGMKAGKKYGTSVRTVAKGAIKLSILAGSAVAGVGKGFGRLYAEAKAETQNAETATAVQQAQARA